MLNKEQQRLYWIYHDAKRRCINPKHRAYPDYGGRGIKFLFNSFKEWSDYMGIRPSNFQMDRINNDGNYEVGNLRWVDFSTQQKNKRKYISNSSGIKGVNYIKTTCKWVARINTSKNGKRDYLYVGEDFFEACCSRLSWETYQGSEQVRNRRGKYFNRDKSTMAI